MEACPQCGSEILGSLAAHYDAEVRKPGADPRELDSWRPPHRKAVFHGFILAVLIWISGLAPFFAPQGAVLRTSGLFWLGSLIWIPIFFSARRSDAQRMAAYRKRSYCPTCGWFEEA
jgi:hypothetical protein